MEAGGGEGTYDHNKLINRDMLNQHPKSSITGLQDDFYNINQLITNETKNRIQGDLEMLSLAKVYIEDSIASLSFELFIVVDTLPDIGETNKIYLVSIGNTFDEYIFVNGHWERIGEIDIDLSNYFTKQETLNEISFAITGFLETGVI